MKLAQRLERLERNHGGPVRIAAWLDSRGELFLPSDELRRHVEEQATQGPEQREWRYAVFVDLNDECPIVVLFERPEPDSPSRVVELP